MKIYVVIVEDTWTEENTNMYGYTGVFKTREKAREYLEWYAKENDLLESELGIITETI